MLSSCKNGDPENVSRAGADVVYPNLSKHFHTIDAAGVTV
jgi:hypothetical protein